MEKYSKSARALDIYVRLCEGKVINKTEEADKFGVDERSIQRDIDDIRAFMSDYETAHGRFMGEIKFDRVKGGYVLNDPNSSIMSNDEILAVSKILLESRAFKKEEINSILDKLISGCVPQANMKMVSDLLSNEKFHYVEPKHKSSVKGLMWNLGSEIKKHNLIEIRYKKQLPEPENIKRVVQPMALIFSEYYFYLNAFIVERNAKGIYEQVYDYPAIFRLDRIDGYKELGERFRINYSNRFEEGEFRKRVQFMFPGDLVKLQFRYTGGSIEAILDRLPTAKVLEGKPRNYVVEAEVFGKGIMMWLLSQGTSVEILRPQTMRIEMKKVLQELLEKYE